MIIIVMRAAAIAAIGLVVGGSVASSAQTTTDVYEYRGAAASWVAEAGPNGVAHLFVIEATQYRSPASGDVSLAVKLRRGTCREPEPSYFECTISATRVFRGPRASMTTAADRIEVDIRTRVKTDLVWEFESTPRAYTPIDSPCEAPNSLPRLEAQGAATAHGIVWGRNIRSFREKLYSIEYRGWAADDCNRRIPGIRLG